MAFLRAALTDTTDPLAYMIEIYHIMVLEPRGLRVRCCIGWFLLRLGREGSILCQAPHPEAGLLVAASHKESRRSDKTY